MKAKDVRIGGQYMAKVSGQLVRVEVTGTVERFDRSQNGRDHYLVTNLRTGRKLELRSAARLRPLVRQFNEGNMPGSCAGL